MNPAPPVTSTRKTPSQSRNPAARLLGEASLVRPLKRAGAAEAFAATREPPWADRALIRTLALTDPRHRKGKASE